MAGLTVAIVVLPQSMAYALIAGVNPVYGLYTSIVAAIIGSLCGSGRWEDHLSVALGLATIVASYRVFFA